MMRRDKAPTAAATVVAALLVVSLALAPAGCGTKKKKNKAATGYPRVERFSRVEPASKAAGFKIRTPEDAAGGTLKHVDLVLVTSDRKFAELLYSNALSITEAPKDESMNFDTMMAEHQSLLDRLPRRLQTYEKPVPVDIAGNKGLLWVHRDGIIVEEREGTGVPSFHTPYLRWWDGELDYRLSVDDPDLFKPEPEDGFEKMLRIARSMY